MSPKDAKECAKWMHGLFPSMTTEQVCICADEFLKHDVETVRGAVREHRFLHAFADLSQIREAIGAVKRRRIVDTSADREAQLEADRNWQRISEIVCSLPDENLAELKAKALLLKTPPELREFYATRDPRKSKPLMSAIYELIESEGASAA